MTLIMDKNRRNKMKVLCILYDDPTGGMPTSYPLSDLPIIEKYPDEIGRAHV